MRMSHVYQPVMLRLLLGRNGRASVQDVARALLNEDRKEAITNYWDTTVLPLPPAIELNGSFAMQCTKRATPMRRSLCASHFKRIGATK